MTIARSFAAGVLAGACGTLAMDLVWFVRYKRGGGEQSFPKWEFPQRIASWDQTSAPAKVGKLLYETITHRRLPVEAAALTTNVMHWAYGVQWGILFRLAIGSRNHLRAWQAPLFGSLVWLAGYVSLPIAGFYKPIWSYDLKTLWDDLSAHLVYGAGVAGGYWVASRD